jgi:methionyl-tRNA synthetase
MIVKKRDNAIRLAALTDILSEWYVYSYYRQDLLHRKRESSSKWLGSGVRSLKISLNLNLNLNLILPPLKISYVWFRQPLAYRSTSPHAA